MDPQKTPQDKSSADNAIDPEATTSASGAPPVEGMDGNADTPEQAEKTDVFELPNPDSQAPNPDANAVPGLPPIESETAGGTVTPAGQTVAPSSSMPPAEVTSDSAAPTEGQAGGLPVTADIAPEPLPVSAPTHHKKGLLFGLILAAILLLLSGGAAASYYYVVNKPENVLKQALANSLDTEKTKTIHFSGSLGGKDADSGMELEATLKGAMDNKTGAFDVSGSMDLLVTNVTFDLRSIDAKTFYAKFGGLGGLPELMVASGAEAAAYAPLVGSLDEQWIEINESLFKQLDSSYETSMLTDADIKKITDAYLQHSFLVVDEVLPDQAISGENCHHYKVVIDATKLKSFLAVLKDAKLDSYNLDDKALTEYNKRIDEAELNKYPFELWISKSGKMIKQATLKFSSEGSTFDARLTVDSYNQPVKVEKPDDSKSLLEVMGSFFGGEDINIDASLQDMEAQSGISL